ncbi:hypothetical protein [Capnocytophaga canis]|uniref:hypothetical protein n=1 Tax=Capnocytophaga canis TaxID=1848903 RepID=UPI00156265AD|nr:hypothetical protein [Capnocytophaga canis]
MQRKKIILAIFSVILMVSCSSLGKGGKNLYASFFAEQGILYFIKPIELTGNEKKAFMDFTFKSKQTLEGNTRVNISFHTDKPIHKIIDCQIVVNGNNFSLTNKEFMFIEKKKDKFESRFSFELETPHLKEIFTNNAWTLNITEENNTTHSFRTTSLSQKKINLLRDNLFTIFTQ